MAQLINEAKRFQKLANIKEAESPVTTSTTIASKIDQNLDKIESLPVIQQTANKIMNDPKLMQQFQQGLAKMGVNIDLMKEGEDIDSGMLSKIVNAVANKEKQMNEEEYDDRGGAILRGLFGMPILLGVLDSLANTGIINTISKEIGTNVGLLATMAVGALIGGIVGAITHKKRNKPQQESLNIDNIDAVVNEALTKFRKTRK